MATKPNGILWTRQSVRFYDGKVVAGQDPMGRKHFWFTVIPIKKTDAAAIAGHSIAATSRSRPCGSISLTTRRVSGLGRAHFGIITGNAS